MAFSVRHPVWLPAAPRPTALAFTLLFTIESLARALVATVISLQAYDLVQSSQKVSWIYTGVGVVSLATTLVIPLLINSTARRFVYTFGALGLILAAGVLATYTVTGQVVGMFLRVFGAACLNITTSLYILDHIRKVDLVRVEPMRMSFSTVSWTIGPALGVWLYTTWGVWAPHAASALCTMVLLGTFWYLRLSDHKAIQAARTRKSANPLKSVRRFVAQPRLRLAWMIAFGRSCFWATFFIYAPILMVTSGLGKQAGGWLISAGNAVLIGAVLFGRLAERVGVRQVIAWAFAAIGLSAIGAGFAGEAMPMVAASLLLVAATGAAAVDGVGSIPFLRAVHAHERAQMAGVYRTYLDISELVPSLIFSVILAFLPLGSVFVVVGLWALVCAVVSYRYLPRSL